MSAITLMVSDEGIKVVDGIAPKSRIAFNADGLQVYKKGTSKSHHDDAIPNLVMQICIDRHIPLITLRRAK